MGTNIIVNDNTGVKESLARIEETLARIEETMAVTKAEFDAEFAKMDAAITEIAADINDLIAKLQAGGMTDAEEAQTFADLQSRTAALAQLGTVHTVPPPTP